MNPNKCGAVAFVICVYVLLEELFWKPEHALAPTLFVCTAFLLMGVGEIVKAILETKS